MSILREPYHIFLAGKGGQGVSFLAQLLCQAAFHEGKQASLLPHYQMGIRGGCLTVKIMIATERVLSIPYLETYNIILRLHTCANQFQPLLADRHIILDAQALGATKKAYELGFEQGVNMVLLGALLSAAPVCSESTIAWVLKQKLHHSRSHQLSLNLELLEAGRNLV